MPAAFLGKRPLFLASPLCCGLHQNLDFTYSGAPCRWSHLSTHCLLLSSFLKPRRQLLWPEHPCILRACKTALPKPSTAASLKCRPDYSCRDCLISYPNLRKDIPGSHFLEGTSEGCVFLATLIFNEFTSLCPGAPDEQTLAFQEHVLLSQCRRTCFSFMASVCLTISAAQTQLFQAPSALALTLSINTISNHYTTAYTFCSHKSPSAKKWSPLLSKFSLIRVFRI